jgi:hypothetical protein
MTVSYLHVVLFNFKDEVREPERARVTASIRDQASFPGVESMLVAPNLCRDPARRGYEWVVMLDFADEAASLAFRTSAYHRAQVERDFTPNRRDFISLNLHQPFDRTIAAGGDRGGRGDTGGHRFRRLVLFNFQADVAEADRARMLMSIRARAASPGVDRIVIGRNAIPTSDTSPLEWLVMTDFTTQADHDAIHATPAWRDFHRDLLSPALGERTVAELSL